MSRGVGTPSPDFTRLVLCSSRIMSMHSSTHSSQMNTVGPAMSFRTSCWLLPQKEQYRVFLDSPPVDLLMVSPFGKPAPPFSQCYLHGPGAPIPKSPRKTCTFEPPDPLPVATAQRFPLPGYSMTYNCCRFLNRPVFSCRRCCRPHPPAAVRSRPRR